MKGNSYNYKILAHEENYKPLTVEEANDDGIIALLGAMLESVRKDYIRGKADLLLYYGDITEAEYNRKLQGVKKEGIIHVNIRLYFRARNFILGDPYGLNNIASPEEIFHTWDIEVREILKRRSRQEMEERKRQQQALVKEGKNE